MNFEYKDEHYRIAIKNPAIIGDIQGGMIGTEVIGPQNKLLLRMTVSHSFLNFVISQHGGTVESWLCDAAKATVVPEIEKFRRERGLR